MIIEYYIIFFIMRKIFAIIILCTFYSLYSQIVKTVDSYKHGMYYGTVSFTISKYVIVDSVIKKELDSIFIDFRQEESKMLFALVTRALDKGKTEYVFLLQFTPCYCEESLGYFKVRGLDVLITGKTIPPFLRKTKNKKRFSYKRRYYSRFLNGETVEMDIEEEDDGPSWNLILQDGHFKVNSVWGGGDIEDY